LQKLKKTKSDTGEPLQKEREAAREIWLAERIEKDASKGMAPEATRRIMEKMLSESILHPSMLLTFDNDELGTVSVGDVLASPSRFEGETLADPIEGIEYGTWKGIDHVQKSGEVTIHSCAHGLSVTYRLRNDYAAIETAIMAAPTTEAVDILCRIVAFREMTHVEETRLIELAASRSGGTKQGDIRKMLKGARGKKRADTADLYKEIDALNMDHSFVVENGKSLVFHESIDHVLMRLKYARMTPADFKTAYANMKFGGTNLGVAWLLSERRRQYMDGVVFDPANREGKNTLNLWKGIFVKPAPGSWAKLKEHMLMNICAGNAEHYHYLMKWMANGVQHPELQGRVAVVMRGKEGVGKGILARTYIYLFGQHRLHISNAKYLIGNFNAHLEDCAALFADEAFFAGDKQHVGILKAIITEPTLTIERKRIDAVTMRNFLHLMMASNEDWVVPASIDARRFFVLNVGEVKRRNEKDFKAIIDELEHGGYEAMLDELLKMDLSDFDVAACPDTVGLQDQKKLSLPNEYMWLMEILQRGYVYSSTELDCWNECVSTRLLYASYERFMEKKRSNFPLGRESLGKFLISVGFKKKRGKALDCDIDEGDRKVTAFKINTDANGYRFGMLKAARKLFEKKTGLKIDWEQDAPAGPGSDINDKDRAIR